MRIIFISLVSFIFVYGAIYKEGDIIRQKEELKKLKQELDEFYQLKNKEYKQHKQEITQILNDIKKQKKDIINIKKENQKLLQEIRSEVFSKTIKIYNKAKPKVVANIFTQMIKDGKIDEVFDIIIKMKTKNVTTLLKFLKPKDAALLTDKLQNYKPKGLKKEE